MPSDAQETAALNLQRVDDILSFHTKSKNPGVGAPPTADASLVLGATALTYAAWEVYVEDLAIEVTSFLAKHLTAKKVPEGVRKRITDGVSKWDLAGTGWKKVWRDQVHRMARGTPGATFGLNTAGPEEVLALFGAVGVDPFKGVRWSGMSNAAVRGRVVKLVKDRGTVVHTGQLPSGYGLAAARKHRAFVKRLLPKVDATVHTQVVALTGKPPW